MTWPFCEAKSLAIIPEISNIEVLETIAQTFNAVGPLRIEKFYSAASAFLLTKPNFFDPLAEIKAKKDSHMLRVNVETSRRLVRDVLAKGATMRPKN